MSNASTARGLGKKKAKQEKPPREPSVVTNAERHQIVANALLEGASESDALRAGGYHPSNAKNVMRQESIQDLLEEGRREIEDITTIKRLDVLCILLEAINMARLLADPGQMINGADKIAKIMGYYAPEKKELTLNVAEQAIRSKLKQMTDEELLAMAAGNAKVVEGEVIDV